MTWVAGFLLLVDTGYFDPGYQPRHRSKRLAGLGIGRLARRAPDDDRSGAGASRPAGHESLAGVIGLARDQYPEPPPDEVCELPEAGAVLPDAGTSCQTPPERLRPLPVACPGLVSPMYV